VDEWFARFWRFGPSGCFSEVFILIGLHGAVFVSVVDAGVTGASLVQSGGILKNGVDSIGVTKWHVWFCGSADSKGVSAWRMGRIAVWWERRSLAANMQKYSIGVIDCQ